MSTQQPIQHTTPPSVSSTSKGGLGSSEAEHKTESLGEGKKMKEGKNVIDIIIFEHNVVRQLYQEYKNATAGEVKQAKCHLIIRELVQHSGKEEEVLYPFMKKKLPNGEQLVEDAKKDHQQITEDLYELDRMEWAKNPSFYEAQVEKLMTDLLKHVDEEEQSVLPMLRDACSPQELMDLAKSYQSAMVTTRPHPSAPREGIAATMAHAASIPIDAARDAARFTQAEKEAAKRV